ncbi:DoxX family protein [Flavobacterium pectinovorum]|uniref:DoxX family protein n=1 Tax=Flavobacterium pectinovorum TaxID=29533 RepID=UPI001FAC464A|nr:DoxX family protein [Flavobacterium pectinovorum]MCI9843944.1 DoxX family membrane protein [Flavobacterium pectinovorum]
MYLSWHLYLMAFLYIVAGINHFRSPGMYLKIIPSYFSNPKLLNILSGAAEIILGFLLIVPFLSPFAAWGIIALLIAVFPANIFMYQNKKAGFGLPKWILLLRMPLQLLLILWAYQYTL